MSLEELKARAYDALSQIQAWQTTLNQINQEIAAYPAEETQEITE